MSPPAAPPSACAAGIAAAVTTGGVYVDEGRPDGLTPVGAALDAREVASVVLLGR